MSGGLVQSVARQALVNVAAALLAAWLIGQSPELRAWMRAQTRD